MKFIPLKSQRLKNLLQSITDVLYTEKYINLIGKTRTRDDQLVPGVYPCSDAYLEKAQSQKISDFGFPRACLGLGMKEFEPALIQVTEPIRNIVDKIGLYLGTPTNALTMAYPDKGFIGWHHNGNAPGFNILMTYSQDGDGCFKYYDCFEKKIVTMPDVVGWSVKVGYYPDERKETERVYWHCAETKKQRISVAWVINHRPMWENMIDSITEGDFDKSVLHQFQMAK